MDEDTEHRIRQRAYQIWLDEGQPEGKEKEHWELAKFAIAQNDGLASMLKPIEPPVIAEPVGPVENLGEFPTLTDQGEGQAFPSKWPHDT